MRAHPRLRLAAVPVLLLSSVAAAVRAQPATLADYLSPPFPYDLVAARAAERIAWIAYERGMRNVYTAAAPDFRPTRLTDQLEDDGIDLSALQISTDGDVVAYLRGHARNREGWVANPTSDPRGGERVVWAASTRGGEPWRVVEADAFALSPDGRWVAYEREGQVHRVAVNPGLSPGSADESHPPLFRAFGRNGDPVWSPDGTRIAFVSRRGDHSFIGVYDTRAPRITYLAPSVDRDVAPVWSPDGRRIAFLRRPGLPFGAERTRAEGAPDSVFPPGLWESRFRGGHTLEIWVADAESGQGAAVWRNAPADERFAEVRELRWAGDHLLFEAEPGNWRHWFSIAVSDPEPDPVLLTPGEGFAEHVAVSADDRFLYYAGNMADIDRRDLWRVPVGGGRAVRLTDSGILTYPAALASGDRVAALYADERRPQSVAVLEPGGEPRPITDLPRQFPLAAHVEPENVTITAEDGVRFNNQLFLPPDLRRGDRRPALIFIHGGSRRQMLLGYHYMHFYHMAYAVNQYFANKGYVVLSVNYRSGIGYGREFRTAPDVGRRGNAEYRDILAAGLYLRERPDVDPQRVGLWGLSYGGILTAQGLARNSDVFAAGVDMAGVHLWGDTLGPENVMYRASSASEVRSWRSPVLLIHGDDDRNVAFSQTVGLVQLLRANDVPYELIVFPDEVHDFLLHERWLIAFNATDDFFERTLVRKEPVRTER